MNSKSEMGGAITTIEKNTLRSRATEVLHKVKSNLKEQKKVPYRVNARTVILVSPSKFKTLNK